MGSCRQRRWLGYNRSVAHLLEDSAQLRLGALVDKDLHRRLCRARDFLAANIDQPVRLHDAAREACLSQFHFHRLFQEAFDETPHQFVSRLRIERAKRLLIRDGLGVTEVCMAVGFESLGSFSTRFRTIVGESPSEFRRNAHPIFAMPKLRVYKSIPACFIRSYNWAA
jgi:AraC-like DNA-binding protein